MKGSQYIMEIERKWMVKGWPQLPLKLLREHNMRQGYLTVRPTVRIREEELRFDASGAPLFTSYILCFKTGAGIVRNEIEIAVPEDKFRDLEQMIALPLIPKLRRTYALTGGLHLEVSHVDEGLPTEFWYAEIEFPDEKTARTWNPSADGLDDYLNNEVSEKPGSSMGEYWEQTRVRGRF